MKNWIIKFENKDDYLSKCYFLTLSFSILYLVHFENLYVFLGHHAVSKADFIDWEFIRGFAKCTLEDKNRFYNNNCDIFNRRSVYPPIWSYTPGIVYFIKPIFVFWLSFFLITFTIMKFIKLKNIFQLFFILIILYSPAFLYAYERLNIDIFILVLTFILVYFYHSKSKLKKIMSKFLFIFLVLLKIYPVAISPLFLNLSKKKLITFFLVTCFTAVLFLFFNFDDYIVMMNNKDMAGLPGSGTFGGSSLFYFLTKIFGFQISPYSILLIFFNILFISIVFFIKFPKITLKNNLLTLDEKFWITGFLILIFCFIIGYHVNYRLIFILLLIPLFFNEEFKKDRINFILMNLFFIFFLIRFHSMTLVINLALNGYFVTQNDFNDSMYDIYDSLLQWAMIVILLIIFRRNNFYEKLIFNFKLFN